MRGWIWGCALVPVAWLLAGAPAASADSSLVWLAKPDGCKQCEPCRARSLREVVADLEQAGVRVHRSTEHFVPVCAACVVCASGRVFAVHVDSVHVAALGRAGWSPMRELPVGAERHE
jgi:hypothetical protein